MVQERIGHPDRGRRTGSRAAPNVGFGTCGPLWHGAEEGHRRLAAKRTGARRTGRRPRPAATRADRDRGRLEGDADAAVTVGPQDTGTLASIRDSVAGEGWPYGLPVPADATATVGSTASRKASVDAVRLPWWAILSRSTRPRRASNSGSTSSSTSPVSRNRRPATEPSRTIDTLLIPVPVSGGSRGTEPGIGHSTSSTMSSTDRRSPAASRPPGVGRPASSAAHAAYPGPGPSIPGSNVRPTRYRSSSMASPATWSSCGCDRTTASSRRSHGGIRRSSSTSSRSGSGPPSMSRRPPREPSTRIASPCPTSRTVTVGRPEGRSTTTAAVRTIDDARAISASRVGRHRVGRACAARFRPGIVVGSGDGGGGGRSRPTAPPLHCRHGSDTPERRDDVRWRVERCARVRHVGGDPGDRDHDRQRHPAGEREDRASASGAPTSARTPAPSARRRRPWRPAQPGRCTGWPRARSGRAGRTSRGRPGAWPPARQATRRGSPPASWARVRRRTDRFARRSASPTR